MKLDYEKTGQYFDRGVEDLDTLTERWDALQAKYADVEIDPERILTQRERRDLIRELLQAVTQ